MAGNTDKLKALQLTMDRLEKTYGKGTVMKLGDEVVEAIDAIPSGSLNLDLALGQGFGALLGYMFLEVSSAALSEGTGK